MNVYKGKGDALTYGIYRGIKLLEHTVKDVTHPGCSDQPSRLPGKRAWGQFPPTPKRFMTYMVH